MKSLFDEATYNEVLNRIDSLNENSERQWGRMTAGQMAWHCQFPIEIGIKNKNKGNGNLFVRLFFKRQMYSDKDFRKNLPTAPNLKAKEEKDIASKIENNSTFLIMYIHLVNTSLKCEAIIQVLIEIHTSICTFKNLNR